MKPRKKTDDRNSGSRDESHGSALFRKKYGPWALVSGASAGIGAEFAKLAAAKGLNIALVARREVALEKLANVVRERFDVDTRTIVADLATDDGIEIVKKETHALEIGLLINNAGREDSGHFLATPIDEALDTLDLNCRAPLQLTHHFAGLMAPRGKGGVIFMASIVAFQGVPYIANYAATKAYDLILAESLGAELKRHNIDIVAVAPGFTRTELSPEADFRGLPIQPLSPASVAAHALKSLGKRRLTIPGAVNKFLYVSGKYFQPRMLNTFSFGQVFRRVLRRKIREPERAMHPNPIQAASSKRHD